MSYIYYDLNLSANLTGMAPIPIAGGGFGVAALPAGMHMPGTYIIVNTHTNNRYIGIANDIANRFSTRLATITEMGFSNAQMGQIGVTWGQTRFQHTAGAGFGAPGWHLAAPAPPAAFQELIDGVPVNLERLMIRFVITQLGAGGTVSNNAMAAVPYINPTPNAITVRLQWGAMGGLFAPGFLDRIWGVGVANAW